MSKVRRVALYDIIGSSTSGAPWTATATAAR
jgi:hypothetical protein